MNQCKFTIDWIDGNCPVQAEGSINGARFYFRSRGEHWSMEICKTDADYLNWPEECQVWERCEPWGDGPYAAGWMPEEDARQIIERCARAYADQDLPTSAA